MKLYLTRHGETDWNLAARIQGSTDIELNATGIRQAEELAAALIREQIHPLKIYSSPLKRAEKTAQVLSDALNVPVEVLSGLTEINFGSWEGLTWDEVREHYEEDYLRWRKERRYERPTQGESYQELLERVVPALRSAVRETVSAFESQYMSADETVSVAHADPEAAESGILVVVHSAIILSLQAWIHQTPFYLMAKQYPIGNAGTVVLDSDQLWPDRTNSI